MNHLSHLNLKTKHYNSALTSEIHAHSEEAHNQSSTRVAITRNMMQTGQPNEQSGMSSLAARTKHTRSFNCWHFVLKSGLFRMWLANRHSTYQLQFSLRLRFRSACLSGPHLSAETSLKRTKAEGVHTLETCLVLPAYCQWLVAFAALINIALGRLAKCDLIICQRQVIFFVREEWIISFTIITGMDVNN